MFADVVGFQFAQAETNWIAQEREAEWLETRSDQIYRDLMNDRVVESEGQPCSMDNVIEEVVCSDKFRALAIECLTHPEDAGYQLRNLLSAAGEKLSMELARKEQRLEVEAEQPDEAVSIAEFRLVNDFWPAPKRKNFRKKVSVVELQE